MRAPVVALTGAGLSTASGIPDFRSPGGVWDQFDPMEFTIQRFHADSARFWDRRARLIAAMDYLDAEPNAAHVALATAAAVGRLAAVITQNVDGLHLRAGTPLEHLVELHGNGARCVCMTCFRREETREVLARRVEGVAPTCGDPMDRDRCGGVLKPDVVLFGEPVPQMARATALVEQAKTLLVAGTSLRVYPAAGLVDVALASKVDVVIVDQEPTPYDALVARVVRGAVEVELPRLLAGLRTSSSFNTPKNQP